MLNFSPSNAGIFACTQLFEWIPVITVENSAVLALSLSVYSAEFPAAGGPIQLLSQAPKYNFHLFMCFCDRKENANEYRC